MLISSLPDTKEKTVENSFVPFQRMSCLSSMKKYSKKSIGQTDFTGFGESMKSARLRDLLPTFRNQDNVLFELPVMDVRVHVSAIGYVAGYPTEFVNVLSCANPEKGSREYIRSFPENAILPVMEEEVSG